MGRWDISIANSGSVAEGRSFMPYAAAKAGLRKALGKVAAGEPGAIVREVFGRSLTPRPR
jgi:hypothetical protein